MTKNLLYGTDLFGDIIKTPIGGILNKKYIVPPFSVLNARSGFWQDRKRRWIGLGIKSEMGRRESLTFSGTAKRLDHYRVQRNDRWASQEIGSSIFDPVLCELIYEWFCPKSGQIIDPFAGGSVRGIVAAILGYRYWGCDLSAEQIVENKKQWDLMKAGNSPQWICGDSVETLKEAPICDFIFTCPPYGDLEKYSDDPRDLSNMEYHTFIPALKRIIFQSVLRLNENRFACIVIGDFRDEKGFYRNFVSDTINAFLECGLKLYNEMILVTQVASLPIRIGAQFETSRKIGKTHQNILIFVKGDPVKATNKIKENAG